jgi:hypothetical protein
MPLIVRTQIRRPPEQGSPPMPPVRLTIDNDDEEGS